nr:hypothetical protein [Tanacetum cinerariifolium]
MTTSAIAISSDSFDKSVGSPPSWVIVFGDIPTVIPFTSMIAPETFAIAPVISSTAPVVETTIVASPTGLCGLLLHRFYSPILLRIMIHIRLLILLRNHHRRTLMLLPLLVKGAGLAWRRVSPRSLDHHLSSFSLPTDSSPFHSSSLDAPVQAHSRSSTRVVSPRLGYPPRFRDSYSHETCMEEDTEIDTTETEDDRELDIVDGEIIEPIGGDSSSSSGTRDGTVRLVEDMPVDLDDAIHDFYHHNLRTMTNTRSGMTPVVIKEIINRHVAEALETHKINRNLGLENRNRNGIGNGNGGNGNGNGGNGNGQRENGNGDGRGDMPVARECTYQDFMKCQPLNFKGTEGVVGLTT